MSDYYILWITSFNRNHKRTGVQIKRQEWLDRNPDYNKIAGKRFRAGQRMERQKRHEQYLKDKKEAIERATGGKFL